MSPLHILLLTAQESILLQILGNLDHAVLDTLEITPDMDLRILRCLVRSADARELRNLALSRLLIQALRISCLSHLQRNIHKHLHKRKRLVVARRNSVQVARLLAIGLVRRDKRRNGNGGRIRKKLGNLCYPPDVLVPVLLGEAQVLVEPEAHVVAVEAVRGVSEVQEVLLERGCDGGFARGGQAREPDCEALLLAVLVALGAGEGRVPGDVGRHDVVLGEYEVGGGRC
jgi:hypothetical protein